MKGIKQFGIILGLMTLLFALSTDMPGSSVIVRGASAGIDLHPANKVDHLNYGYVNDYGSFAIKQQFKAAGEFTPDGCAVVQALNGKYGVIDRLGRYIVPAIYSSINDYENGFAVIMVDTGYHHGIIDKLGNIIVKPQYDSMDNFNEGIAIGTNYNDNNNQRTSYAFDTAGKLLFSCNGYLGSFHNGLAVLQNPVTQLYGYVNASGKILIKQQYDYANEFVDGKAEVRIGTKYYDIDRLGKMLNNIDTSEISSSCLHFDNGFTLKNDGLHFVLYNNKGKEVIKNADMIFQINSRLYEVSKQADENALLDYELAPKAVFDGNGKQLTAYIYFSVRPLVDGMIAVCTQKETYLVDSELKEIGSFHRLQGDWNLSMSGNLIEGRCNNILRYYTKKGKLVFQSDGLVTLNHEVKISTQFYTEFCVCVTYPQIERMRDNQVKELLNEEIKAKFIPDEVKGVVSSDTTHYMSSSISQIGDILHIRASGWEGFRYMTTAPPKTMCIDYYFDLKTGREYHLEDLFKKDSDYKVYIQSKDFSINGSIQQASNDNIHIDFNQITGFEVLKDKIHLYYIVYALDLPLDHYCDLTYSQLDQFIDKNDDFWKNIVKTQQ